MKARIYPLMSQRVPSAAKQEGARRQRDVKSRSFGSSIERLEKRQLLSVSVSSAGVLTVTGTAGADIVAVDVTAGLLKVKEGLFVTGTFSPSDVQSIVVNGLGGDDLLQVFDGVTVPAILNGGEGGDYLRGGAANDLLNGGNGYDAMDGSLGADVFNGGTGVDLATYAGRSLAVKVNTDVLANDGQISINETDNVMPDVEIILGGAGNDLLTGGPAANVLIGNAGNDTLLGEGGRDVLIGGLGKDSLNGGSDEDLLIGSSTVHDTVSLSLRVLSAEWRRTDLGYNTRINRLKAGVAGVRIDGAASRSDLISDTLTGGTQLDWFATHWGDLPADRTSGEIITLLPTFTEKFDGNSLDFATWEGFIQNAGDGTISQDDALILTGFREPIFATDVDYTTKKKWVRTGDRIRMDLVYSRLGSVQIFVTNNSTSTAQSTLFDTQYILLSFDVSVGVVGYRSLPGGGASGLNLITPTGGLMPSPADGTPLTVDIWRVSNNQARFSIYNKSSGALLGSTTLSFVDRPLAVDLAISLLVRAGTKAIFNNVSVTHVV